MKCIDGIFTGPYPTDDLIRLWRSKVKVTAGRRGGEDSGLLLQTKYCGRSVCLSVCPCVCVLGTLVSPRTVLDSPSLTVFKSRLKGHLFHLANTD